MAQAQASAKRQQIDKSISTMVIVASIALFVTIFSLASADAMFGKLSFQNRVISGDKTARSQLNSDIAAASSLNNSYNKFNTGSTNLLGAAVTGIDNDNAKIVLDALPSDYDYPALITSVQNLLSSEGVNIDNISGTDVPTASSTGSVPIGMPFSFSVDGPYANIQNVINTFEKSIRPFEFQTIDLSGNQSDVTLTATAQTFFQPASKFTITQENVK